MKEGSLSASCPLLLRALLTAGTCSSPPYPSSSPLFSSSSSSSTELRANLARKAASQSGQGRCAPSWSMRDASRTAGSETVSPESGGVTWRGGQQLELGARETPAGCRLRCSLYPLCDSGQRFPIASDPFLPTFDCYETLYL